MTEFRKPTLKERRLSELRHLRSQRDMQAYTVRRFLEACTPEQLARLVAEYDA